MPRVTDILLRLADGGPSASDQLLPVVYDELRKLAATRLAEEKPGQTLQATALVHEAYLRLVGEESGQGWNSRSHFFGAAAEAMRRILVENARHKKAIKHGGDRARVTLDEGDAVVNANDDLLALDEALEQFEKLDAVAAQLVKLRYFAGLTMPQAAAALGIPLRTAERNWSYAKSWLHARLAED
jgi:RNA polymerase sigma factor (TIGR02999 family)